MKKFALQFVLLAIVIFVALMFYSGKLTAVPFLPQPSPRVQVTISEVRFKVELADTPDKRRRGLGGRESLASDGGMLFVFEKEDRYSFWMKGVKFPLDFIWIKGDKIVDTTENAPPPSVGAKDEDLPIYASKEAIDKLLEVNGGFVSTHNIKIGDTVSIQK